VKLIPEGTLTRLKARSLAKGYSEDSFSLVTKMTHVFAFLFSFLLHVSGHCISSTSRMSFLIKNVLSSRYSSWRVLHVQTLGFVAEGESRQVLLAEEVLV